MIYFTSDTHFQHVNVIKYCENTRGHFTSVFDMDETLIHNWNAKVKPTDILYHLGDFAFGNHATAIEILKRLNGNKIIIFGNHDNQLKKKNSFLEHFIEYHDTLDLEINVLKINLCHKPPINPKDDILYLHGHLHGTGINLRNTFDVGVDTRKELSLYSLDEILKCQKTIF